MTCILLLAPSLLIRVGSNVHRLTNCSRSFERSPQCSGNSSRWLRRSSLRTTPVFSLGWNPGWRIKTVAYEETLRISLAGLAIPRGFEVIVAILGDRSAEREVHAITSAGGPSLNGQIRQDRYYAAHLLGDLKDPRAIPILVPLLTDPDVNYIVPWSLGQIADRSAIRPLIESLSDPNPSMRVLAVYALVELKATEALPRLRQLLDDDARSNFGKLESVAEAAQTAIVKLQSESIR